jgi:hypothetical protein
MTMTKIPTIALTLVLLLASSRLSTSFVRDSSSIRLTNLFTQAATTTSAEEELSLQKKKLFGLLRTKPLEDPVLADPITKEGVTIASKAILLGGQPSRGRVKYQIKSASNTFSGSSDSFLNLLEPETGSTSEESTESATEAIIRNLTPLIPPPLRSAFATAGLPMGPEYVPMRDLFTSPAVSFAYERGWRQGFGQAGFPGPDKEASMAMEYFASAVAKSSPNVLVDMSCATGLFTRRFAKTGKYNRVLGCDYSASMLDEARRRIQADSDLSSNKLKTQLDLVRLDVGQIPMKNASIDALHAGAVSPYSNLTAASLTSLPLTHVLSHP